MIVVISLILFALLYAVLFRSILQITIPIASNDEQLHSFVRQLANEAKQQDRKHLTQQDRKQITSFAGKNHWSELDVIKIQNIFTKVVESRLVDE